jgi:hypothetical protein
MAGVRLGDAERIASERLDGATDGSLKEALAIVPPSEPPSAGLPLIDRIEAVAANRAAETEAPSFDVTLAGEASDRQPMPVQAPEPSASVPVEGGGAAWAEEGPAAPSATAAADAGIETESRDDLTPAGDKAAATVAVPAPSPGAHESTRPLASALDAAAKLAADANAAAAALENLKRLLERQLPSIPDSPAPAAAETDAQTSASAPTAPTLPPPLPSLPLHAVRDGSGRTTLRPAVLAPPPPRRAQPERIRLDVRGFLAGFALSWAFGVVLYLFMTAG